MANSFLAYFPSPSPFRKTKQETLKKKLFVQQEMRNRVQARQAKIAAQEAEKLEHFRTIMQPPSLSISAERFLQKQWMSALAGIRHAMILRQEYETRKKEIAVLLFLRKKITQQQHFFSFSLLFHVCNKSGRNA
jgi:hypothetical protein